MALEQKVTKVFDWNKELFDEAMSRTRAALAAGDIEQARIELPRAWKLAVEMHTLCVQWPEGKEMFRARHEEMEAEIDEVIRQIEDAAFKRWAQFHYEQYVRTGPYIYADYPYYGQPQHAPQGPRENSSKRPPNWGYS